MNRFSEVQWGCSAAQEGDDEEVQFQLAEKRERKSDGLSEEEAEAARRDLAK